MEKCRKILREEAWALFVDFQERLVPVMAHKEALIAQSVKLARGLEILGVPCLVSEQYPKGLGHTVPELREVLGDGYLEKMTFSCMETPVIRAAAAALGQERAEEASSLAGASGRAAVIVCGIEAHICVEQTVLDLLAAGNRVVVVADCVDSRHPFDCQIALERMRDAGAVITTCEALLYELTHHAGNDRFRAISKLTK